jgi:hypothetical protein
MDQETIDKKEKALDVILSMLDDDNQFFSATSGWRLFNPRTIYEKIVEEGSVNVIKYTDTINNPETSEVVLDEGKINLIKV